VHIRLSDPTDTADVASLELAMLNIAASASGDAIMTSRANGTGHRTVATAADAGNSAGAAAGGKHRVSYASTTVRQN
jgi:hypothetical protein